MNLEIQVKEWTSAQDIISSVPEVAKLNIDTAKSIADGYSNTILELIELAKANADLPYVSSEDDFTTMQKAGDLRKQFKKIRTKADGIREALKKDSLQYGKAVQAVYNQIESKSKAIESYLQEQETYAERMAKKRQEELHTARMSAIPNHLFGYMIANMNYGDISEQQFQSLLGAAQAQYDDYIKEQKRKMIMDRYAIADSLKQFLTDEQYIAIKNASHDEWVTIYNSAINKQKLLIKELERERAEKERIEKERQELERKNALLNAAIRKAPEPTPFIEEDFPFADEDYNNTIIDEPITEIDITIFELENRLPYEYELRIEKDGIRLEQLLTHKGLTKITDQFLRTSRGY